MTLELTMLLWSTLLTFLLILIPAGVALNRNGPHAQGGPRDDLPEPTVFQKRASRLSANMQENMVLFAALVLTAHVAGISNAYTMLGAQIFFYARVAHAIIYIMGWPMVRPLFWFAGVVGMGMIAAALF